MQTRNNEEAQMKMTNVMRTLITYTTEMAAVAFLGAIGTVVVVAGGYQLLSSLPR